MPPISSSTMNPDITSFRVIAFDMRVRQKPAARGWHLQEDEYKLTSKFYEEFVLAFCRALELEKPVIMGQSMGGNICLPLLLENDFTALISLEGCDHSPVGGLILFIIHIHGNEVVATSVFGLMAPDSPDEYRWETWWYYAQGGPKRYL